LYKYQYIIHSLTFNDLMRIIKINGHHRFSEYNNNNLTLQDFKHGILTGPAWSWSYNSWIPMQSVPMTTNVVRSKSVHGEVYSIKHYVIKFVSDLRQVGGFLRILRFPPPIKLTATI